MKFNLFNVLAFSILFWVLLITIIMLIMGY